LIVDDYPGMSHTSKTVLMRKGFEVDASHSPLEVLKNFKPGYYDSIISDMYMQEMNGLNYVKHFEE
jgi:DNA-binding NtrC family response regulator